MTAGPGGARLVAPGWARGRGVVKPDFTPMATARASCPFTAQTTLEGSWGVSGDGPRPPGVLWLRPPRALRGEEETRCSGLRARAQAHARHSCLVCSTCSRWGHSHHFLGGSEVEGKHVKNRATSGDCEVLVLLLERLWSVCTLLGLVVMEGYESHHLATQAVLILWPPFHLDSCCPDPTSPMFELHWGQDGKSPECKSSVGTLPVGSGTPLRCAQGVGGLSAFD